MEHHPEVGGCGCSGGGETADFNVVFLHPSHVFDIEQMAFVEVQQYKMFLVCPPQIPLLEECHKLLAILCKHLSINLYPDSVAFMVYPEGAASLHWSFTHAALKRTMGGTTMPPALMYVTTVLVSPFSPDTVWKARSPLTPITFCDFGTSCKPLSSMFQMLLGWNSIFHFLTHCTKSSKNFSIWTGFVPIARTAEIF